MKSGDAPGEAGAQVLRGSQVYKVSPWANRAKSGERRSAAWTQPLLPSLAKLHCDLGPHRRVWNAEAPALWCQDAALGAGAHTGKGDLHSPSTDLVYLAQYHPPFRKHACAHFSPDQRPQSFGTWMLGVERVSAQSIKASTTASPARRSQRQPAHSFVQYCCIKSQPHARHWGPCGAQWSVSG